jgi:hypothetical protein
MFGIRNIMLIPLLLMSIFAAFSQEEKNNANLPWPEITEALGTGNAKSLARHFSNMVDLGLPQKDDSYSKSQGEIIMGDFFEKCPAQTFEVIQKGEISHKSHFAICKYHTAKTKYRVSIHLQFEDQAYLISKIKFEKQED